ncbi:hypothetical protein [Streptomyces sp. NPDC001975]
MASSARRVPGRSSTQIAVSACGHARTPPRGESAVHQRTAARGANRRTILLVAALACATLLIGVGLLLT